MGRSQRGRGGHRSSPSTIRRQQDVRRTTDLNVARRYVFERARGCRRRGSDMRSHVHPFRHDSLTNKCLLFQNLSGALFQGVFTRLERDRFFRSPMGSCRRRQYQGNSRMVIRRGIRLRVQIGRDNYQFNGNGSRHIQRPEGRINHGHSRQKGMTRSHANGQVRPRLRGSRYD